MPIEGNALVFTQLCGNLDEVDAEFDISFGDNTLQGHSSPPAHNGKSHSRLMCFRVLRAHPSAMPTVLGAPRISGVAVAVLEHVVDDGIAEISSCRVHMSSDGDLDGRTFVVGPSTFEYDEIRRMRRATINSAPTYDFGALSEECKCTTIALTEVVHKLLHTMMVDGHTQHCYILNAASAARNDEHVFKQLQALSLVDLLRSANDGETHWAISSLGKSSIRMTFGFHDVEALTAKLPGQVPCHS